MYFVYNVTLINSKIKEREESTGFYSLRDALEYASMKGILCAGGTTDTKLFKVRTPMDVIPEDARYFIGLTKSEPNEESHRRALQSIEKVACEYMKDK